MTTLASAASSVPGATHLAAAGVIKPAALGAAQIESQLEAWVDLAPDCEHEARLEVRRRLMLCLQKSERWLELSHLPISSLPQAVGSLRQLEQLSVLNAGLRKLPPELGRLSHLKSLHLGGNDLAHLPPELAGLKNLRRLFLNANQFTDLPGWLPKLARLELLHVQHNRFDQVPLALKGMTGLNDLDVRNNRIRKLPDWLRELNLRYLDISGNPIPNLDALAEGPKTLPWLIP